jgi:hypothetical protein
VEGLYAEVVCRLVAAERVVYADFTLQHQDETAWKALEHWQSQAAPNCRAMSKSIHNTRMSCVESTRSLAVSGSTELQGDEQVQSRLLASVQHVTTGSAWSLVGALHSVELSLVRVLDTNHACHVLWCRLKLSISCMLLRRLKVYMFLAVVVHTPHCPGAAGSYTCTASA